MSGNPALATFIGDDDEVDPNAVSALLVQLAEIAKSPLVRTALLRNERALFSCHGNGRRPIDDDRKLSEIDALVDDGWSLAPRVGASPELTVRARRASISVGSIENGSE